MEVLLARADFLRHALPPPPAPGAPAPSPPPAAASVLRAFFPEAAELMGSYFPDYADRSLRLPGYWAHVEAVALGDAAAARAVWEGVLKGPLGRYAGATGGVWAGACARASPSALAGVLKERSPPVIPRLQPLNPLSLPSTSPCPPPPHPPPQRYYEPWAAYVAMERALRAIPEARGVYKRAWSRKMEEGGQLAVCYDWLRFEREEGRWAWRLGGGGLGRLGVSWHQDRGHQAVWGCALRPCCSFTCPSPPTQPPAPAPRTSRRPP
jgi:hypothetical protein